MVVNLCLNPFKKGSTVDQEQFWVVFPIHVHVRLRHAMYTGKGIQWLWVEFDSDTHGPFNTSAQYEYKLVVTL